MERLGLVEARCDTYAGIIFATWDEDAPTLEAYLGDFRWYTDIIYNHRDEGMQMIGPVKWPLPVNWKTPVDNDTDYYHGSISHFSARIARAHLQVPSVGGPCCGKQRLRLAQPSGGSGMATSSWRESGTKSWTPSVSPATPASR